MQQVLLPITVTKVEQIKVTIKGGRTIRVERRIRNVIIPHHGSLTISMKVIHIESPGLGLLPLGITEKVAVYFLVSKERHNGLGDIELVLFNRSIGKHIVIVTEIQIVKEFAT